MLRDAFYRNLVGDCRRLDALATHYAIACSSPDAAGLKDEIRWVAHRIYGAAVMFGAAAIASAAEELERVVFDGMIGQVETSVAPRILRSLRALVDAMAGSKGPEARSP